MSDSSLSPFDSASHQPDGFCIRFGQLLAALNISQNEFARQLGSTSAFVSNMARGKSKPGLDFLQKIAETFSVSLDWLVLGQGTLRGDQYLDPEIHHAVMLRVALAEQVSTGNAEAGRLASELQGEMSPMVSPGPERQRLLEQLAEQTQHGPLIAMLYNRYLPMTDAAVRNQQVLRDALQLLRPGSSDPLAAMVKQGQTDNADTQQAQNNIQIGLNNRAAARDYYER